LKKYDFLSGLSYKNVGIRFYQLPPTLVGGYFEFCPSALAEFQKKQSSLML
jgi:hypothetical protein